LRSKKRSATTKLREDTTFFLDRSIGRFKCARPLRDAGLRIEIHDDHFAQNTADEEWIARCGRENWVVITGDIWKRGRKEAPQVNAVAFGRVRVFQLATNDIPSELWAQAILKAERKILKILKMNKGPFMARVTPGGNVTVLAGYFERQKDGI
jgi:hypothetical protein